MALVYYSAAFNTSCQVYPSEYAYHNSVNRAENASANCRNYPAGLHPGITHSERYIHCNGTQLKLADSYLGSELFSPSDYYVWPAGTNLHQLLFTFPMRANLTTITLHYYSDSARGLPRLRFFAVPDDFNIWDAPSASYRLAEVATMPPDGESAGHRNVSIRISFATKKVLMFKSHSTFSFAVSEVEFFTCLSKFQPFHPFVHSTGQSYNYTVDPVTTEGLSAPVTTTQVEHDLSTTLEQYEEMTSATIITESPSTVTGAGQPSQPLQSAMDGFNHAAMERFFGVREVFAWTLVAVLTQAAHL